MNIKIYGAGLKFMLCNAVKRLYNGEVILDSIEQIYDQFYEFSNNKKLDNQNEMSFEENLKRLNYKFVGDKFYLEY